MKIEKRNGRCVITADNGKIITDGNETMGKMIILATDRDPKEFYEIDEPIEEVEEWNI